MVLPPETVNYYCAHYQTNTVFSNFSSSLLLWNFPTVIVQNICSSLPAENFNFDGIAVRESDEFSLTNCGKSGVYQQNESKDGRNG
jgi:hypothetical protein